MRQIRKSIYHATSHKSYAWIYLHLLFLHDTAWPAGRSDTLRYSMVSIIHDSTLASLIFVLRRGAFQTITTVYASEVLPVSLRGYLTSFVNLCWVIGQLIASGVLVGFQTRTDIWGWRIPFAIQWVSDEYSSYIRRLDLTCCTTRSGLFPSW